MSLAKANNSHFPPIYELNSRLDFDGNQSDRKKTTPLFFSECMTIHRNKAKESVESQLLSFF